MSFFDVCVRGLLVACVAAYDLSDPTADHTGEQQSPNPHHTT